MLTAGGAPGQGGGAGHVEDVEAVLTPALGEAGQVTELVISALIVPGAVRVEARLGDRLTDQRTRDDELELVHHWSWSANIDLPPWEHQTKLNFH